MQRSYRSQAALAAAVGFGMVSASLYASPVSLVTTDAAGQTSFLTDTLSHWSPAGAPVAGNAYTVPGTLALRTLADGGDAAFAGDSLTIGVASVASLTLKNATGATITVNNLTLDGGQIQNGGNSGGAATSLILAGSGISVTANGGTFNTGAAGRNINVTAPVSGAGNVSVINGGLVRFTGGITNAGNININASMSGWSSDVTRPVGTGAGALQINGNAGFAAYGATRAINLGGSGAQLTWGSGGFAPGNLILSNSTSDATIDVQNAIDLGATVRTIQVDNGSANADAMLSGALTCTAAGGFTKTGTGVLVLSGSSPAFAGKLAFPSGGSIGDFGIVRITNGGALGSGTIDMPGNNTTSQIIEVAGGITVPNNLFTQGRAFATSSGVFLRNLSDNNTWNGNLTISSTGGGYAIESAAGKLTIGGVMSTTLNAATQRTFVLQGAGNGEVSGVISNGATATPTVIAVSKAGAGRWTLSGANTYTGPTAVSLGILSLGASNRIADVSVMSLGGGTFDTGGFSEVLSTLGMTASSSIDLGAGASILSFANSSAQAWTGTLTVQNWSGSFLGGGTDQLYVGIDSTGLTAGQLAQVTFAGYAPGAAILPTGEIVPVPEPTAAALLGLAGLGLLRRRSARR